jgi:hypothetical protein
VNQLDARRKALACIDKSRQLESQSPGYKPRPPDAFDRFFEAMAYHGLGDRENARRCYREGCSGWTRMLPATPICAASAPRPQNCCS